LEVLRLVAIDKANTYLQNVSESSIYTGSKLYSRSEGREFESWILDGNLVYVWFKYPALVHSSRKKSISSQIKYLQNEMQCDA
jgi:hypothetical protein